MSSRNARVGAVALLVGSAATVGLNLVPELVPLRIMALALCVFGAWAFADEMGAQKPLNRAGLVALGFAALAKTIVLLGVSASGPSPGNLLYAFSLLLALLFWSLAFLHRGPQLRIAGAFGASVTVLPIALLIAGHIFVGVGGLWGIGALYAMSETAGASTPHIITIIDTVFLTWSLAAAAALWTNQIRATAT